MAAALAGDNAGAWAGGDVVLGGSLPTAQAAGRGVLDTLSVAYGGSQSWALESAQFSLRRQPGPQPEGWRYTPTAPPSFNDATAAICDASSEDLLISMLRYHPALASQKNKYGVTLLHWAAYYCASDATVRALVAANADAARQASASDGCLPLHIGAAWNLSPFGLATIFAAHPGAVKELDANGLTPAEKAEQAGHSAAAALLNDREALLHALTCDDQRGRLVKAIMDKCSKQKTFKQADKLAALRLELEALELGPLRLRAIAAGVDPRRLGCAICRRPSLSPILTPAAQDRSADEESRAEYSRRHRRQGARHPRALRRVRHLQADTRPPRRADGWPLVRGLRARRPGDSRRRAAAPAAAPRRRRGGRR